MTTSLIFPNFDNSYLKLGGDFYSNAVPANCSAPRLIKINHDLAAQLGFNLGESESEKIANIFCGNELMPSSEPIALAYAGHQFGHLARLGDGRAILMGEVIDLNGLRKDIQLKGAGPTPYSRGGDGFAAIGPVIREYIMSEAMHNLGVATTRSLAMVLTGNHIWRDELLQGAVLTRVAASHIRIGTFALYSAMGNMAALKQLADYAIGRHYPQLLGQTNKYQLFLAAVIANQASLIAKWMQIGFIHGVMNTDNMTISGETIDYGPCAFLDEYDPQKAFSSIDRNGRYAFANQPIIAGWNLARLAEALLPLLDEDETKALNIAQEEINSFGPIYRAKSLELSRAKIGLTAENVGDEALFSEYLDLLHKNTGDFANSFADLANLAKSENADVSLIHADQNWGVEWRQKWRARLAQEEYSTDAAIAIMRKHNPIIIPRNHQIAAAITAAQTNDDFTIMDNLIDALRAPFDDNIKFAKYKIPPTLDEKVEKTFCGT